MAEGRFDAAFLALGAHLASASKFRGRCQAGSRCRHVLARHGRAARPKLGRRVAIYGGGNTAIDVAAQCRAVGDGTGHHYLPSRFGPCAGVCQRNHGSPGRRRAVQWLRRIAQGDESTLTVEMALDEQRKPQPTGRFERIEADSVILALGQRADTGFSSSGIRVACAGGRNHRSGWDDDDWPSRYLRRRRRWCQATQSRHGGHRPGKKGRPPHRCLFARLRVRQTRRGPATFSRLNTWYYTDADASKQPLLNLVRRRSSLMRSSAALMRTPRSWRHAAVCPAATASL